MPTLAKLLDCLKWPKVAAGGTPVRPRGEIVPVSDPELTFGWQGNLFTSQYTEGVIGANTVLCSVTIPDDCFYILDATASWISANLAALTARGRPVFFEILDAKGVTVYSLQFAFLMAVYTAVGVAASPPAAIYNMRMHLPQGAVVQWRLGTSAAIAGEATSSAISIRKLYEENM